MEGDPAGHCQHRHRSSHRNGHHQLHGSVRKEEEVDHGRPTSLLFWGRLPHHLLAISDIHPMLRVVLDATALEIEERR